MAYARERLKSVLAFADSLIARNYVQIFGERNSLITVLFHTLFHDGEERKRSAAFPHQDVTIAYFRQFLEYFLEHNFHFVSDKDILAGLTPDKNYILVTFDDGYYCNYRAVPILQEYNIPGLFFISANHVKEYKAFWWETLFRERKRQGISEEKISEEEVTLRHKRYDEIEQYVVETFGSQALEPHSELERPFTSSELRAFAGERCVFIGNHTSNHAYLTSYSSAGVRSEIHGAQHTIREMTGITPLSIAYPFGVVNDEVIRISDEVGLKLGVTTVSKKNHLPIPFRNGQLRLSRYTLWGNRSIRGQCDSYRSDIQLMTSIQQMKRSWNR